MTAERPISDSPRSLREDFRAWWADRPVAAEFIRDGLIVLDASVLLHLYRVTSPSRAQILSLLRGIRDRLWLPHQSAIEFHRHRLNIVPARLTQFKELKRILREAAQKAETPLNNAVAQFSEFRTANMVSDDWTLESHNLDPGSFKSRLEGVLDPALSALAGLEAQHDLSPASLRSRDLLLDELDDIFAGRIGEPYRQEELSNLVSLAIEFRYPNQIPPGYRDAGKSTNYLSAGDFILWQQIIDRCRAGSTGGRITLVTRDVKEDWWTQDARGRPDRSRPELGQELYEASGVDFLLISLSDFILAAAHDSPDRVSSTTVDEARMSEFDLEAFIDAVDDPNLIDLLDLSPSDFDHLCKRLLKAMGYVWLLPEVSDPHGDLAVKDGAIYLVQIRQARKNLTSLHVRQARQAAQAAGATRSLLITTGSVSEAAQIIGAKSIEILDGRELLRLLSKYLKVNASIA